MQVLFLQGQTTCFGRKRPSSGVFKTSTAATGTCVIVVGQSSHLLIRAEGTSEYTGTSEHAGTSEYTGTSEHAGTSERTGTSEHAGN